MATSPFTPEANRVLEGALQARLRGDQHVGTAHLLLSLLREPNSVAARILPDMGVDLAALEQQVNTTRIHHPSDSAWVASFDIDREMVQQRITQIGTEGTTDALGQD